ncbi:MAG: hypothetical protein WCP85_12535 [Mariniphaga sp.]
MSILSDIKDKCIDIWEMILSNEITKEQQDVRDFVDWLSNILKNISFVLISLLFFSWGMVTLYHKLLVGTRFNDLILEFYDQANFYTLGIIIGTAILYFLVLLQFLLFLFKWVKAINLFKLWVIVEVVHLFITIYQAEPNKQAPIFIQMFSEVFEKNIFKPFENKPDTTINQLKLKPLQLQQLSKPPKQQIIIGDKPVTVTPGLKALPLKKLSEQNNQKSDSQ